MTADFITGTFSYTEQFIQSGNLNFSITNLSTETISVKTVQLFDGASGNGAGILSLGNDIAPGLSHEWSIPIPEAGIYSPVTAVFTYTYRGEEHTCSAVYELIPIKSKRR